MMHLLCIDAQHPYNKEICECRLAAVLDAVFQSISAKQRDLIRRHINLTNIRVFLTTPLGSGEPDCPDGTFTAGYTMDAWERWRIVCLAALSVEDIEDIYLFGTMITGILLIGLGFALGYRKIQKT